MSKKWVVLNKKADFNELGRKYGISPYLARIIRNRDIISDEDINMFLNGRLEDMHDPKSMKDLPLAADILRDAIEAGAPIRVVGDYDADGVCASFILQQGLEYLGAKVDVRIPDRVKDGYGINEQIIGEAAADGVELIITCDNGIAAMEAAELAVSLGITMIVTDHHEVPFEDDNGVKRYILPPADAVVDPKREDCEYPYKGICGAMVAYKLICFMLEGEENSDTLDLKNELLTFAAFATVCDVMELKDENRIAVKYGIELLKNTTNIGMRALINAVGLRPEKISVYSIGFVLGPCVNATGRLDTAKKALELFTCLDTGRAAMLAQELKDLNDSRKDLTLSFAEEAIKKVENEYADDKVLVVYIPQCHESIAGIVAGRIREKFYKPTIVLTNDAEGGVKGSGRSIEGYNMFEELSAVKELFTKFGGHKMAAGMSLEKENVDLLRERLNKNTSLTDDDIIEKVQIDIPMPIGYVTREFVEELDRLSPYGVANPNPLFAQKDVAIKSLFVTGQKKNVLKMTLAFTDRSGLNRSIDAVYFGDAEKAYKDLNGRDKASFLYQAGLNEYMGKSNVQLTIKDYC